jgi:hypothetical protein
MDVEIPGCAALLHKAPSILEMKAYRDTWSHGLDSFLHWLSETFVFLRELLAPGGSIYTHIGPNVSHSVKLVMDETFGAENYLNQLIWKRTPFAGSSKARAKQFPTNHDCILLYRRGLAAHQFQHQYSEYSDEYKARFKYQDERGLYRKTLLKTYSEATAQRLMREGRWIDPSRPDAYPSYKQYLHESKGKQLEDLWPPGEDVELGGDADDDNVWEDVGPFKLDTEQTRRSVECFCGQTGGTGPGATGPKYPPDFANPMIVQADSQARPPSLVESSVQH